MADNKEQYVSLEVEGEKEKKKKEKKKKKHSSSSSSSSSSSGSSSSSSSGFLGDMEDFFEGKYFAHMNFEEELDKAINESKVPRDAQTEKRCQMFSVFVTLISLLAIFFFAMTKPVWTTTRFLSDEVAVAADDYKALCDINSVIPDAGTAECTSTRSRNDTVVECLIRCTHGIDEDSAANLKINEDGLSFRLVCNKTMKDWIHDVNNICLPSPDE